jgi:hypothetical protein
LKEEEQQKDIEVEELRLRRSCRIEVMLLLMKLLYDVKVTNTNMKRIAN